MTEFFTGFFPHGFWKNMAIFGMAVCFVAGVDLLFGSRLMRWLSGSMNKKIHIDELVVKALANFKKGSDKEFDMEGSLLHGSGRFVASAILFICVYLMFSFLIPRLS